ncbi:uncharacterized protein VP01_584g1 [Puccinia sorghi]|uniref:Cryptic loci regulator 2 N-terminal domain-containing protein n=1 Tax=Puccinia sorghi TaxID=27349 RepID=A0A0L6UIS0_9BASI|nr:uncharacterized protein VP01_584g1 [Puccinia sorghi]
MFILIIIIIIIILLLLLFLLNFTSSSTGSQHVPKFRTANEFSPHFHWLCNYEPTSDNRIYCKCKYCSGAKTQGSQIRKPK